MSWLEEEFSDREEYLEYQTYRDNMLFVLGDELDRIIEKGIDSQVLIQLSAGIPFYRKGFEKRFLQELV